MKPSGFPQAPLGHLGTALGRKGNSGPKLYPTASPGCGEFLGKWGELWNRVWRIPREVGRIIQRGPLTKHMLQNVFWLKLSSHFGSSKTPTRKKTQTLSLFFRGGSIFHPEKKNKSLSLFLVRLSSHFGSTPTRKKESRFCLFDFLIQKYVFY